jgi:hypothetical protein
VGLAASWVSRQVARQAHFPPPPTLPVTHLGDVALLALLVLAAALAVWSDRARPGRRMGRAVRAGAGVLGLGLLVYAAVSEDLEMVMLRNTAEWHTGQAWRAAGWDRPALPVGVGALAGHVTGAGDRPLAGAQVVVAAPDGTVYQATSGADGDYQMVGLPAGNYLPLAVAPGYGPAPGVPGGSRVATVRPGATAGGTDFRLATLPAFTPTAGASFHLGEAVPVTVEAFGTRAALRRSFAFANAGLDLTGGLVYEPPAALGPGPFPLLLIIYPGEARNWENISVPLAASGYVVVSYFPRRLVDLAGDMGDLQELLGAVARGQLSARGDRTHIVLVGGSMSTAYLYMMAAALPAHPAQPQVRGLIQYGGLFDLFAYRNAWQTHEIVIDPGISDLETLLVAMGDPATRPELYLRLSPRYGQGPASLPPALLIHAGGDTIVPPAQSRIAADTLAAQGLAHRLGIYPHLVHYLDPRTPDPAQVAMFDQTLAFLQSVTGGAAATVPPR